MKTIIDHLTRPIAIAKSSINSNTRVIMYVYADAFTICDCGSDLKLTTISYGSHLYKGQCLTCGKKYTLCLNKLQEVSN